MNYARTNGILLAIRGGGHNGPGLGGCDNGLVIDLSRMGISPYLGVPVAAAGLMLMVLSGSYLRWERITIFFCLLDLAWLLIAFQLRPGVGEIVHNTFIPTIPAGGVTGNLMFLVIAIVGTTIAPWQLFFQQSCIADKRLRFSDLKWARLDTLLGATFTIIVAGCMTRASTSSEPRNPCWPG